LTKSERKRYIAIDELTADFLGVSANQEMLREHLESLGKPDAWIVTVGATTERFSFFHRTPIGMTEKVIDIPRRDTVRIGRRRSCGL